MKQNTVGEVKLNEVMTQEILVSQVTQVQCKLPFGTDMFAPSKMAWAKTKSCASVAREAARRASHISLRPSKAGAVSQNSSRLLLSCPSVSGTSDFQRMVSWQSG